MADRKGRSVTFKVPHAMNLRAQDWFGKWDYFGDCGLSRFGRRGVFGGIFKFKRCRNAGQRRL